MNTKKYTKLLCFIGSLYFQNICAAVEEYSNADALFEMIEYYDTEVRPTESPEAICDFCAEISKAIITENLSRADLDAVRAKAPTYAPYLLDFSSDEIKDVFIARVHALIEFYQGGEFHQGGFSIKKYLIVQHQDGYRLSMDISPFGCIAFEFLISDYIKYEDRTRFTFAPLAENNSVCLDFLTQRLLKNTKSNQRQ
jgi:hypothetical protein